MKRCNACDEEFANKFSFCPVDGTPLNDLAAALLGQGSPADKDIGLNASLALTGSGAAASATDQQVAAARTAFKLTIIGGTGLPRRLAAELSFVIVQMKIAWPAFKRDPLGSSAHGLAALACGFSKVLLTPNAIAGGATALLLVLSAVLALLLFGHSGPTATEGADIEQPVVQIVSLRPPDPNATPEGDGVGAGASGRVGLATGKGEGSKPDAQRSGGGGGGGENNPLPQSHGAVPQSSAIPAPINPPLPNAVLPVAGIDVDAALLKSVPSANFGDPRSNTTVASKGPGDGGGIGNANGQGIGEGNGDGFGKGNDGGIGGGDKKPGGGGPGGANGNDPRDSDRVFPPKDVTQRARVIAKPEPGYTEEARKTGITGTVVLRVVFSVTGQVTNIQAVRPLPGGLTEKAIAAAHQIRFVPAMRYGQPVSVYMQLEYNFNLY